MVSWPLFAMVNVIFRGSMLVGSITPKSRVVSEGLVTGASASCFSVSFVKSSLTIITVATLMECSGSLALGTIVRESSMMPYSGVRSV